MVLNALVDLSLNYASPRSRVAVALEEYHGYLERSNGYLLVSISNSPTFVQPAEVEELFV